MLACVGSLDPIYKDAAIAARSNEAVLILGETGTGKEVLARFIHDSSRRKNAPFIPVNCAAIPAQLLESEIFGSQRGAYTGSVDSRKGVIEQANGGTVLLDEIGELSPEAQAKLLRTIETKEVAPLGASRHRTVDVRFMAATNSDIRARVEKGSFRTDLYYRLSIFVYTLPPLRQRPEDIPLLLSHFLAIERGPAEVSPQVMELLHCYPWPGNIREFKNVVHYAATHADGGEILVEHLPESVISRCPRPDVLSGADLKNKTECFEAHLLAAVVKQYKDPKEASERLGIGLRTYYRKLKKYHLLQ